MTAVKLTNQTGTEAKDKGKEQAKKSQGTGDDATPISDTDSEHEEDQYVEWSEEWVNAKGARLLAKSQANLAKLNAYVESMKAQSTKNEGTDGGETGQSSGLTSRPASSGRPGSS